jgi:hypothetical protein
VSKPLQPPPEGAKMGLCKRGLSKTCIMAVRF